MKLARTEFKGQNSGKIAAKQSTSIPQRGIQYLITEYFLCKLQTIANQVTILSTGTSDAAFEEEYQIIHYKELIYLYNLYQMYILSDASPG